MIWGEATRKRLAERALERQLAYQQRKAEHVRGREEEIIAAMVQSSRLVREKLESPESVSIPSQSAMEVCFHAGSDAHKR